MYVQKYIVSVYVCISTIVVKNKITFVVCVNIYFIFLPLSACLWLNCNCLYNIFYTVLQLEALKRAENEDLHLNFV